MKTSFCASIGTAVRRQSQYSAKGVSNVGKRSNYLFHTGKRIFISPDLSSVDVKKSEALEKVALAVKEAIDHGVEKYELLQYIEQLLNIESAGEET